MWGCSSLRKLCFVVSKANSCFQPHFFEMRTSLWLRWTPGSLGTPTVIVSDLTGLIDGTMGTRRGLLSLSNAVYICLNFKSFQITLD